MNKTEIGRDVQIGNTKYKVRRQVVMRKSGLRMSRYLLDELDRHVEKQTYE